MTNPSISFKAPMIRALLEDRKTQTRRLLDPQPAMGFIVPVDGKPGWFGDEEGESDFFCGYTPGQRLYVREDFRVHDGGAIFDAAGGVMDQIEPEVEYAADLKDADKHTGWKSCRHMAKVFSRITLEITAVKVERLNEISEEDAIAEGVVFDEAHGWFHIPGLEHPNKDFPVLARPTAREMYAALMDTIYYPGFWLTNPWVVCPTLKVHKCNIEAMPK